MKYPSVIRPKQLAPLKGAWSENLKIYLNRLNVNTQEPSKRFYNRREVLESGWLVTDSVRCVQCGVCSYNCPVGIDVRQHAWLSKPVMDSHCLTCGECVARCPRGVLSFERLPTAAK